MSLVYGLVLRNYMWIGASFDKPTMSQEVGNIPDNDYFFKTAPTSLCQLYGYMFLTSSEGLKCLLLLKINFAQHCQRKILFYVTYRSQSIIITVLS